MLGALSTDDFCDDVASNQAIGRIRRSRTGILRPIEQSNLFFTYMEAGNAGR